MPIYFGPVAPHCPISRDSPAPGGLSWAPTIRMVIPRAHDLMSAIAAANIARSIITQLVFDKVINNVHTPPPQKPRTAPQDKVIDKRRRSSWKQGKKVKRKYKYYVVDENGEKDKDNWVMTERIESMSWSDKGWKTSLAWEYGDKGDDAEPVGGGGGPNSGGEEGGTPGGDDGGGE